MATLDDSPSLFAGQAWGNWADNVPFSPESGDESSKDSDDDTGHSMKLNREDMGLFGECPSQDEFYLVVCEKCDKVVKPKAFKHHLRNRHGESGIPTTTQLLLQRSTHSMSKLSATTPSPTKSSSAYKLGTSVPTKASVKEVPPSISNAQKMGAALNAKLKKNHTMPVVKMERMDLNKYSGSHVEPTGKPPLTNGNLSDSPNLSMAGKNVEKIPVKPESPDSPSSPVSQSMTLASLVVSSPSVSVASATLTTAMTTCVTTTMTSTALTLAPFVSPSSSSLSNSNIAISSVGNTPVLSANSSLNSSSSSDISLGSVPLSPVLTPSKPSNGTTTTAQKTSSNGSLSSKTGSGNASLSSSVTKSPSVSNIIKSANASVVAKAGGFGSLAKASSSVGSLSKSIRSSGSSSFKTGGSSNTNSNAIKKKPVGTVPIHKPDKLIPCKDREFDANKHCGVVFEDSGKPCTRSLTCKTHALSLKRKVPGRRKPFDELLKEHRAAKEAFLKQRAEQKAAQLAASMVTCGGNTVKPAQPHDASPLVPLDRGLTSGKAGHHGSLSSVNTSKESSSLQSRLLQSGAMSPQKISRPAVVKPNNICLPSRSSGSGSLHSPLASAHRDEAGPSLTQGPDPHSRLSDGEGEEDDGEVDKPDRSYLPYHPRPAATCTFGARHHTFRSRGCNLFNRRVDVLRAAFLKVLERQINPPPPKKLCVESNLPKEPQFLSNSKDPYEFNLIDSGMSGGTQQVNAVVNSTVVNKNNVKPKSKPSSSSSSSSSRNKSREGAVSNSGGSRSPAHSRTSTSSGTGAVKRKRSGSGGHASSPCTTYNNVVSGNAMTINSSITALNSHTNSSPLTAIAIPSVNLSSATLSHFNVNLAGSKNPKNNLLKDFGLVVRSIDPSAIVNGQYVIGGTTAQIIDEKMLQQTHIISGGNKGNPAKLVNSLEALQKNNLIPANAILVDSAMQPGTVLTPVSVGSIGSVPSNTVISLANSSVSQAHPSPSTTPSPLFRSGSLSPQVSSPLPNGITPSVADKSSSGHRHTLIHHHKGQQKPMMAQSALPGLLSSALVITSNNNPQVCASHVFTQLAQLQVKPGAKTGPNKFTMQPVSLTFPLTNLGTVTGQQPQTHTLFITSSDDGTRHDLQHQTRPSAPASIKLPV